jgi:hypothetical protein
MKTDPPKRVVKRGTFLYDGTCECRVEIVETNIRYGSGDYEDEPTIRDDVEGVFFEIRYESAGSDRRVSSGIRGFENIEAAVRHVESSVKTVKWIG